MAEQTTHSTLQRKARAHAGPGATSVASAGVWRRILPRLAEASLGLELRVSGVDEARTTLAQTLEECGEDALLIGLCRAGRVIGLAVADDALVTGLVECQTTGRISALKTEGRIKTAVDHALVGHVLDAWMQEAAGSGLAEAFGGLSAARRFPDARAVSLGIDDGTFRRTALDLDLQGGKRTGRLSVLLPVAVPKRSTEVTSERIRAALLPLGAEVEAVLCRTTLPFSRIATLECGDLLPLPDVDLRRISIEAPRGQVVALAHLGQQSGHRAVRVRPPELDGTVAQPGGGRPRLSEAAPAPAEKMPPSGSGDDQAMLPVAPPLPMEGEALPDTGD